MRPNDYLVEMYKSDEIMERIRSNLVRQQIKIKTNEEKQLRRENKKFAKKVNIAIIPKNFSSKLSRSKNSTEKRREILLLLPSGKKPSRARKKTSQI